MTLVKVAFSAVFFVLSVVGVALIKHAAFIRAARPNPDATADEPDAIADKPDAIADEPDAIADEPDAIADKPDAIADKPDAIADEPDAIADDPYATADEPDAIADEAKRRPLSPQNNKKGHLMAGNKEKIMSSDWMPSRRSDQLALAKRWLGILPGKETAWRIPEGMIARLALLAADAEMFQTRADSAEGTKGDIARARTAFHALVAHMRDIRRRVFFMPPLTEGDFADLGLEPPSTDRTPHIDVPEMVDFVIHLRSIRELVVDFWVQGEANKAKPLGYEGAVVIWGIRDTPPEHPDDFQHHAMASSTPHILTFEETERGNTVWIALAWQNERGYLGQYSEYKSAVVP